MDSYQLLISPDYIFRWSTFANFVRRVKLTPAIFIAANASRALTRKRACQFNESVIFSGGHYAQLFHNCAQFLLLREDQNGYYVTEHRPLFRACHRNSISARQPTPTRNSNSVSTAVSINYGTGQLVENN